MAPAATVTGAEDSDRLTSHTVHPQKLRELAALRSSSGGSNGGGRPFFVAFCIAVMPLFAVARRSPDLTTSLASCPGGWTRTTRRMWR
jgi:condensin complex subunit 3